MSMARSLLTPDNTPGSDTALVLLKGTLQRDSINPETISMLFGYLFM